MRTPHLSFVVAGTVALSLAFGACSSGSPKPGGTSEETPGAIGTVKQDLLWPQLQPVILPAFQSQSLVFAKEVNNRMYPDGSVRIITGAPTLGKDETTGGTSGTRPGQAWVYRRAAGAPTFVLEEALIAADAFEWDDFGNSSDIDGNVAVVGATLKQRPQNCNNPGLGTTNVPCTSGTAYVFELDGTGKWRQVAQLFASDFTADSYFGQDVAVDGNRIAVSAYKSDQGFSDVGSVYIFERQGDGSWTEVARLLASDRQTGDKFGIQIALEGDQLAVGSFNDDDGGSNAGSVYIFERQGDGTWLERPKLFAADRCPQDWFGVTVDLEPNRVLIGARDGEEHRLASCALVIPDGGEDSKDSGLAYIFERQGNGTWAQTARLAPPDPTLNLRFGVNVTLSGDTAAVGTFNDRDLAYQTGSVYIYQYANGTWTLDREIHASPVLENAAFGTSLSLDGNQLVVGSYFYSVGTFAKMGAMYPFESTAGLQTGAACINDNGGYCLSGFCSDGVCCDQACTGTCESCLGTVTGGTDGACLPIPTDTDPENECDVDAVATCDRDGLCNGERACRTYYPAGTPCGATVCEGGQQTGRSCNGGGACGEIPFACELYQCNPEGTACLTDCADNDDCAVTAYCNTATRECEAKQPNATACTLDDQCTSKFCADGVCCNTACNNPCEACDVTRGTCTAVTGQPRGGRTACITDVVECAGTCDGQNRASCTYPGTSISCGAPSCTDGFFTPLACNGGGACAPQLDVDCTPYACGEGACRQSCQDNIECASGFQCKANECIPRTGRCQSAADCDQGFVCNRERSACVKAVAPPVSIPVGCSVSLADGQRGPGAPVYGLGALLALAAAARLRRRAA